MPITIKPDPAYGAAVLPRYGEFLGTYESEHGHASAQLFRKGEFLKAYLSYKKHLTPQEITDDYPNDLQQIAREHNLTLKILHVGY